ncbi:Cell division control protein 18 [Smittium mucronatum]|uniref:Cell division control protein 18 n=1 Tax=Smittium mucronatum TaxID=133383 RepID=A0A1R0H4W3_9FUNG|nr:Cell division control protein 18 [Smittium mucronatum]
MNMETILLGSSPQLLSRKRRISTSSESYSGKKHLKFDLDRELLSDSSRIKRKVYDVFVQIEQSRAKMSEFIKLVRFQDGEFVDSCKNLSDVLSYKKDSNHTTIIEFEKLNREKNVKNDLEDFSEALNPFSKASKLDIIGREVERNIIQERFLKLAKDKIGGGIYISGNPGTGKTTCVTNVIQANKFLFKCQNISTFSLNCMTINSGRQLYQVVYDNFFYSHSKKPGFDFCKNFSDFSVETEFVMKTKLESMFLKDDSERGYILILDELDHLINLNVKILYSFFEWALRKNSCLYLVGIANALDLTETLVPRLKSRGYFPELINFKPYSVQEILGVLKERADMLSKMTYNGANFRISDSSENNNCYDEAKTNSQNKSSFTISIMIPALELCARKVAASSGDLRKALDACRMAIDCSRLRAMKSSSSGGALDQVKVTVGDMMKVLSSMYGTTTEKMLQSLNFHQKIVLVCVHNFMSFHRKQSENYDFNERSRESFIDVTPSKKSSGSNKKKNTISDIQQLTINQLFEIYLELCKNAGLPGFLTRGEFNDLISMMESIGVLKIQIPSKISKTPNRSAVSSRNILSTKSFISNGENRVFLSVSLEEVKRCISSLPTLSNLIKC